MKVIAGTVKALTYLHEAIEPKVVHRDINSGNILMDAEFNDKLSDFGMDAELFGKSFMSPVYLSDMDSELRQHLEDYWTGYNEASILQMIFGIAGKKDYWPHFTLQFLVYKVRNSAYILRLASHLNRFPLGTPFKAPDAVSNGSPGSGSRRTSNVSGEENMHSPMDLSSPQFNDMNGAESQQKASSPGMDFSEVQRKWKEELDQELERK